MHLRPKIFKLSTHLFLWTHLKTSSFFWAHPTNMHRSFSSFRQSFAAKLHFQIPISTKLDLRALEAVYPEYYTTHTNILPRLRMHKGHQIPSWHQQGPVEFTREKFASTSTVKVVSLLFSSPSFLPTAGWCQLCPDQDLELNKSKP